MRLTQDTKEDLGVFLESQFQGARINWGTEGVLNTTKTDSNSTEKFMARKVVTEERVRWTVNTFMPYKAPTSDGIYLICI